MEIERYKELRTAYLAYQQARKLLKKSKEEGAHSEGNWAEKEYETKKEELNNELELQGWATF